MNSDKLQKASANGAHPGEDVGSLVARSPDMVDWSSNIATEFY